MPEGRGWGDTKTHTHTKMIESEISVWPSSRLARIVLDRVAQDRETSASPPRQLCPVGKRPPEPAQWRQQQYVAGSEDVEVSLLRRRLSSEWTGRFGCPRPVSLLILQTPHGRRVKDGRREWNRTACAASGQGGKRPRKMPAHTHHVTRRKKEAPLDAAHQGLRTRMSEMVRHRG